MSYSAIVLAAGKSTRFEGNTNKLWYVLKNGKPLILNTLAVFLSDPMCSEVVLVCNQEFVDEYKKKYSFPGKLILTWGGETRQESVHNGLLACRSEKVLIHDGARPWIDLEDIHAIVDRLDEVDAVILTAPVTDTIKVIEDGQIIATEDRNKLRRAQTPQGFKTEEIRKCYEKIMQSDIITTDDAQCYQMMSNKPVYYVDGKHYNEKVTTLDDVVGR